MPRLKLCPLLEPYNIQFADEVLKTQAENGMPRTRKDNIGLAHQANYSVTVDDKGYDYLIAFYELYNTVEFEAKIFAKKAIADYHLCKFATPPSPKPIVPSKKFTVSFQLFVRPKPVDRSALQSIVDNYNP